MFDTYQNNNAVVYLYVVLLIYLLLVAWSQGRAGPAVVGGLVLGNYAVVYETHFGLFGLTAALGALLFRQSLDRRRAAALAAMLLLACPVALTQGGPITKLAHRLVPGTGQLSPEIMTPGQLNQHQVVMITFPKKELFQIQLAQGRYQRVSCAYDSLPWLKGLIDIHPGTPYRHIWSWDVLQLHWLPTLLAPLVGCWLFVRRNLVGVLYWIFGALAFLVPALVNFGPVYEFEYLRWEFAAGAGFAIALGMALGDAWDQAWRSKSRMVLPFALGLTGILWLGTISTQQIFLPRLVEGFGSHGYQVSDLLVRPTSYWLTRHGPSLGFLPKELEIAAWLRSHSQAEDRVLVNFAAVAYRSILMESTLAGLTGVRCVGHSLPLAHEPVGTPPFHMSAPARAFFGVPDLAPLRLLEADWVYVRPAIEGSAPFPEGLGELSGVDLAFATRDELGREYRLYKVTPGDPLRLGPVGQATDECRLDLHRDPETALFPGVCYPTPSEVRLAPSPQERYLVYLARSVDAEAPDWLEAVPFTLPRDGGTRDLLLPLVAPHRPGDYQVDFYVGRAGRLHPLQDGARPLRVRR